MPCSFVRQSLCIRRYKPYRRNRLFRLYPVGNTGISASSIYPGRRGNKAGFGREIPYEEMEPGDLVCYSGHVAMYIGGGRIVHASSRKEGIKVSNDPAYRTIVSMRRPWQ